MSVGGLEDVVVASVTHHHSSFAQKFWDFLCPELDLGVRDVRLVMTPITYENQETCPKRHISIKDKNLILVACASAFKNAQEVVYRTGEMAFLALDYFGVKSVDVLWPYHFKNRQDSGEKEHPGEKIWEGSGVTLQYIPRILKKAGVKRVLTMHNHSEKIFGYYSKEYGCDGRDVLYELSAAPFLAHWICTKSPFDLSDGGKNFTLIDSDIGAGTFGDAVRQLTFLPNLSRVKMKKWRDKPNDPKSLRAEISNINELIEMGFTFRDKYPLILDDMVDTSGTQGVVVGALKRDASAAGFGLPTRLYEYFTHPIFGGPSHRKYQDKLIEVVNPDMIITTNSLPYIMKNQTLEFLRRCVVLLTAAYFADAYKNCCMKNIRPSEYYKFKSFKELDAKIGPIYSDYKDDLFISRRLSSPQG